MKYLLSKFPIAILCQTNKMGTKNDDNVSTFECGDWSTFELQTFVSNIIKNDGAFYIFIFGMK